MPVLHKYRGSDEYYVLTVIRQDVVTFRLTEEGRKKLDDAGIAPGQKFELALLLDLCRTGDAVRQDTELDRVEGDVQIAFDFGADPDSDRMFPACAECTAMDDLHLVEVTGRGRTASILCAACRLKRHASIDTSIPLTLVNRAVLNRVLTIRDIKKMDPSVARYKELLDAEFESKWDLYRKGNPEQGILIEEAGDQGRLM